MDRNATGLIATHSFLAGRLVLKASLSAAALLFAVFLSGCESRPPLEELGELEFSVPDLPGMGEPFVLPSGEKVTPRTEEDEMREAMMRQNPNLPVPKAPTADAPTSGEAPSSSPPAPDQNGQSDAIGGDSQAAAGG
ncbi:hypothetical protein JCM17478_06080 [Thermopirellula anaerolimosa]